MDAEKTVKDRNNVYGPIERRSDKYICAGLEVKVERLQDVILKMRQKDDTTKFTDTDIDTIVDLQAYLNEFLRRVKRDKDSVILFKGKPGETPSGLVFCGR